MIQSNELRLGNWVRYQLENGDTKTEIITGVLKDFVILSDGSTRYPFQSIEPIPVTRQILLDIGFTFTGDDWFEYKTPLGKINYNLKHEMCSVSDSDYSNECILSENNPMKYVHQLQNLCYCITGKELSFSL